MEIGCIVKAAGQSRRFGGNKLLASLAGKPVLAWVLDALPRERLAKIAVVTSSDTVTLFCQKYNRGYAQKHNPVYNNPVCDGNTDNFIEILRYSGGPVSESIRTGLRVMMDMDGCLFVSGDQPMCTAESITRMLDLFIQNPEDIIRLSWQGVAGSPVLFPRRYFSVLSHLTGERGGMSIVSDADRKNIRLVSACQAVELWDVDTPDILQKLEINLKNHAR